MPGSEPAWLYSTAILLDHRCASYYTALWYLNATMPLGVGTQRVSVLCFTAFPVR